MSKKIPERRMSIKKDLDKGQKDKIKEVRLESEPSQIHEQKNVEPRNLNEVITKTLSMRDPQYGKNQVFFSYPERQYRVIEREENFINILNLESAFINKDDKRLEKQDYYHKRKNGEKKKAKKEAEEFKEKDSESIKAMRNQLTFSERKSQTINAEILSKDLQTEPLIRTNHSGNLHKWDIFDKYVVKFIEDEEEKKRQEEILNFGKVRTVKQKKTNTKVDAVNRPSMVKTLKIMERQIQQILNYYQYKLYREWNKQEESMDIKPFIPLLKFPEKSSRRKSITSIVWHPKFEDLFAVGYGSYSFPKKKDEKDKQDMEDHFEEIYEPGYIEVYSLKNNYYPEVKYKTDVGILSIDFHPVEYSLLCAGFYDGTVAVFDIKQKSKYPILICDIRTQKHMDPVWQVKWYYIPVKNVYEKEFTFFSISSDGRVIKWSFLNNKSKLESEEIITLKYQENQLKEGEAENKEKADDAFVFGNAGGMCFDFNKHKGFEHLFVLGTEEGLIYLCSAKHRGHFIQTFEGHTMGVYTVSWNPYHEKIFLSCSADWTIKIWHYRTSQPLIIFDMQNPVGDVSWSPWCSTIFGAVTVQGDIKFFDLNQNRKSAIFEKKYSEHIINHISFNYSEFVFITGDEKGKVRLWKMSENVRNTVDKKDEEAAKEAEKKQNAQKSALPETKINLPRNLVAAPTKSKRKNEGQKMENKSLMLKSEAFKKIEKERVVELLKLLDVTDV